VHSQFLKKIPSSKFHLAILWHYGGGSGYYVEEELETSSTEMNPPARPDWLV